MLVCPRCQFENPNTNNFCQECGASLSQNTCPACGNLVSFTSLQCSNCGARAGVTWRAIVQGAERSLVDLTAGTAATTDVYLDDQQRYCLLKVLSSLDSLLQEQQAIVLDCQPFQVSLLEALITAFSVSDETESENFKTLSQGIPVIARPYLALSDIMPQAFPFVRDAWQQNGQQFLLLEDRSALPTLADVWVEKGHTLPLLQVLHTLYEMLELWDVLEPWGCRQSILEVDNLCLDEDHTLCLQQLYADLVDWPPTLQDLAHFWKTLFPQSQQAQLGAVTALLADLEAGGLFSTDEVRSRIEAIANGLQTAPEVTGPTEASVQMQPPARSTAAVAPPDGTSLANNGLEPSLPPASTQPQWTLDDLTAIAKTELPADGDDMPTVVLPMQLFNLDDAGRTDVGQRREHNEDYFGIETQVITLQNPAGKTLHARNLYILCDGMGGHAGGEVASALAVDTLRHYFKLIWEKKPFQDGLPYQLPSSDELLEAVRITNNAIYQVNQEDDRLGSGRMGTTLVMLVIYNTNVAIVHVGDSRAYRYTRKRGLEQITIDHEVGQREIQRGVEPGVAYARADAYQLTQALGPRDDDFLKPDIHYLELNEDTLFLLCSDGLSDNNLIEQHVQTHIEPLISSKTNLDRGVAQLIDLANQCNGHDNITAIAIRAKVRPNLDRAQ